MKDLNFLSEFPNKKYWHSVLIFLFWVTVILGNSLVKRAVSSVKCTDLELTCSGKCVGASQFCDGTNDCPGFFTCVLIVSKIKQIYFIF